MILADYSADFRALSSSHEALIERAADLLDTYQHGDVQQNGIVIEAGRPTALTGKHAGLKCTRIRVVRERGNSAQQMKAHGRNPSRKSVVIFRSSRT